MKKVTQILHSDGVGRLSTWLKSDGAYAYRNLPREASIRILTLLPGAPEDDIVIKLVAVPLHDLPAFEAISYVWGDPSDRGQVKVVNDHHRSKGSISVTNNLIQCLLRFRHVDRDRVLWADAICINQASKPERSEQVKHMAEIYGRAARVLVYLGLAPIKEELRAFEYAKLFARDNICPKVAGSSMQDMTMILGADTLTGYTAYFKLENMLLCISHLTRRPWFRRTWTMQEIGLATQATFFCGDLAVEWRVLFRMCDFVIQGSATLVEGQGLHAESYRTARIADAVSLYHWKQQENSFLDVLETASEREVTDPKDKVYGVLGHPKARYNSSGALLITPNYDLSWSEVYTDAAVSIIRAHQNLDILSHARPEVLPQYPPVRYGDVASWVPNWKRYAGAVIPMTRVPELAACQHFQPFLGSDLPRFNTIDGLCELHAKAVYCGKVRWSTGQLRYFFEVPESMVFDPKLRDTINTWRCTNRLGDHVPAAHATVEQLTCLAATMCAGTLEALYHGVRTQPCTSKDFATFWRYLWSDEYNHYKRTYYDERPLVPQDDQEAIRRCLLSLSSMTYQRSLFCTDTGYLGLGPEQISIDDEVFVLSLGRIPLGLRPVEHGAHILVGECYMHDLIAGETTLNAEVQEVVLR